MGNVGAAGIWFEALAAGMDEGVHCSIGMAPTYGLLAWLRLPCDSQLPSGELVELFHYRKAPFMLVILIDT